MQIIEAPKPGLRECKRIETRQRIAETGLKMFLARGFDATTLDAIAEAANISRRTFFHYFDSKEAILTAWETGMDDAFLAAFARQPPDAAPLEAIHGALADAIALLETPEAVAIGRLMHSTEALRARKQANYDHQERVLTAALSERWPAPDRRAALRVAAMLGIGALRVPAEAWGEADGRVTFAAALDEAFAVMKAEVAAA